MGEDEKARTVKLCLRPPVAATGRFACTIQTYYIVRELVNRIKGKQLLVTIDK